MQDMQSVTSRNTEPQTASSAKIAVIGIGCKFPGAADKEEFWDNLRKGKNHIKEVPDSRWNIEENYSPVKQKGKSISKWEDLSMESATSIRSISAWKRRKPSKRTR